MSKMNLKHAAPVIFAFLMLFALASCSKTGVKDPTSLRGGEARPTLSPLNYTGTTAVAYQAAREIPEILDSLYCYCECAKHSGHKSLLSCYVDEHAVNCDICIDEAVMAYDLHKQGKDVVAIREAVDARYSRGQHR